MIDRFEPAWFTKAKQIAARLAPPAPAARKKDEPYQLYIYDAIGADPWTGGGIEPKDVVAKLEEAKGADLEVRVNSPGGLVFDGIAIANLIRNYPGPKTVYVDGLAASIASVIAIAGDKVVTAEGGMWMIHDPLGGMMVWGTADEIEEAAAKQVSALRKVRENLSDLYVNATGRSAAEVSGWMTSETWMTAAEALERGFTDEVLGAEPAAEPEPRKVAKILVPSFAALRRTAIVEARMRDSASRASLGNAA